jgi:hypothetical protein
MALQPLRYSPRLGSPKLGQGSEMRACACDIPTLSLSREREQEQAAGSRQPFNIITSLYLIIEKRNISS